MAPFEMKAFGRECKPKPCSGEQNNESGSCGCTLSVFAGGAGAHASTSNRFQIEHCYKVVPNGATTNITLLCTIIFDVT